MTELARLTNAVAADPANAERVLALAHAHALQGNWKVGLALVRQAAELHPQNRRIAEARVTIPGGAAQWQVAVQEAMSVLQGMADHAVVWSLLASGFAQLKMPKRAIESWQVALGLEAEHPDWWHALADLLVGRHLLSEAAGAYKRALDHGSTHPAVYANYGAVLLHLGRFERAMAMLRRALELNPALPSAEVCLGQCLSTVGEDAAAEAAFQRAVAIEPGRVRTQLAYGSFLVGRGRGDEAEARFRSILQMDPDHAEARMGLGSVYSRRGDHAEAVDLLRPVVRGDSPAASALGAFGRSCVRVGCAEEARAVLESQLDRPHTPTGMQELYHTLGTVYEALGDYGMAFAHHQRGNRHREMNILPDGVVQETAEACRLLSEPVRRSSRLGEGMIFIVGMLRSGTSLTEQILARHPAVVPGGELPCLSGTLRQPGEPSVGSQWAARLAEAGPEAWDALGEQYLAEACRRAGVDREALGSSCFLTDKLPTNYLMLGAIPRILPGARIIHCQRAALDACLSCFFQNFGPGHAWTTELSWIASIYRAYRAQMEWWTTRAGIEVVPLPYESLVANLEGEVRRLLAALGLPFHPDCLTFHRSARDVRTASVDQVRRPIYQSSRGRAERYRPWLGPLIAGLGDLEALPPAPELWPQASAAPE